MPIYEYRCEQCGHHFSLRESMSKNAERKREPRCESCHSRQVRKVLGPVNLQTSKKS